MDSSQIENVINWIVHNIVQIILVLSLFIQFTPKIKWNPWTSLIKWAGKLITTDITKQINDLSTSLNKLQKDVYENEKDRIRWEILDFANSCRNNHKHTKDEYEHIITLNKKYIKLLKLTDDNNGVFEEEYKYIQKLYADRLEKNDFL